ncbi:porin family protein [Flavobacterium wongokense]|uniref:porin family protein n=1 Tax=Flavobacterium wongokense TaxID=2910674 RepID=UPI001F267AE3|nr:porin family protein [Flavobacterium sp. WG47]MCF6133000.1 porin family protein [Flavobacterium sp. WG47]
MKKIILTVAAVFALTFANAQDKKESTGEGFSNGDLYLTGTVGFNSTKVGDFKADGWELSPGVGYFIADNLAIEGKLNIMGGKNYEDVFNDGDLYEVKTTGFGIAAGVKYFWTPASKFSLSIGGNLSYDSVKRDITGLGDSTSKIIGVNVPLGMNYFVSDDFALTAEWGGFGYSSNDNGGNGADKTTSFNLGVDLSAINFGVIYKL